jgi:hypothetical protein
VILCLRISCKFLLCNVHYSAIFCHSLDGLTEEEGVEDNGSMYSISTGTTHCGNAVTELGDNTCILCHNCDCNEWVSGISAQTIQSQSRIYEVKQSSSGIYNNSI